MILRRLLFPAVIALPLWMWGSAGIWRGEFGLQLPSVADWVFGIVLNVAGIFVVCWPLERWLAAREASSALRATLIFGGGATGGFLFAAAFALGNPSAGVMGLAPGAITALVWMLCNRDLFHAEKEYG